jgi:hypothetical protein
LCTPLSSPIPATWPFHLILLYFTILCKEYRSFHWRTQRGSNPPPPEIILKFWQSRTKFPVPWKIHPKNLIRIRVSPICKLGGTPD